MQQSHVIDAGLVVVGGHWTILFCLTVRSIRIMLFGRAAVCQERCILWRITDGGDHGWEWRGGCCAIVVDPSCADNTSAFQRLEKLPAYMTSSARNFRTPFAGHWSNAALARTRSRKENPDSTEDKKSVHCRSKAGNDYLIRQTRGKVEKLRGKVEKLPQQRTHHTPPALFPRS